MVDSHGQGAWDCLRGAVRDRVPPIITITQQSDSQYQFSKNMILPAIFFKNIDKYEELRQEAPKMRTSSDRGTKSEPKGTKKVSQGAPKVSQKGAKGRQR